MSSAPKPARDLGPHGRAVGYDSPSVEDWPDTDLHHAADNRLRPRELTIFNEAVKRGQSTTAWISADIEDVVSEEEWR